MKYYFPSSRKKAARLKIIVDANISKAKYIQNLDQNLQNVGIVTNAILKKQGFLFKH